MSTTPKLKLTELTLTASQQATVVNADWAILDQLVNAAVKDKDLATPPGSPADGDAYIVAASPTGAWSDKAGQIAYWRTSAGAWAFIAPLLGWMVSVLDELDGNGVPKRYGYTGSAWTIPALSVTATPAPTVIESTTARTLSAGDAGSYIRTTNASAKVVTVPPQSSVAWAADTEITLRNAGAGALTLTPGSGVTLNAPAGGTLVLNNAMTVTIKRVASDAWDVIGQTVPT